MTIGVLFWVVYVVVFLVGAWAVYAPSNIRPICAHVGLMILTFLLGWGVFGPIVHN